MSGAGKWLERLLDWAGGPSSETQRGEATRPAAVLSEPAQHERGQWERSVREREIELRVLMSNWM